MFSKKNIFEFLAANFVHLKSKYRKSNKCYKHLAILLTGSCKVYGKFDKMNINTLPQLLLRCTLEKLLANVGVPSKRNPQQKQKGRLQKQKKALTDCRQNSRLISLEWTFSYPLLIFRLFQICWAASRLFTFVNLWWFHHEILYNF